MRLARADGDDRERVRERMNAWRVVGGKLLMMALLLYFFHLAEAPMGQSMIGVLAALFAAGGATLLWLGWRRLRELR
jgi:Na+/melibiose symporter-like transporter